MRRIFVPEDNIRDGIIQLDDPEALFHLSVVLRMGIGDILHVSDGRGHVYEAKVSKMEKKLAELRIVAELTPGEEARISITLYQGLPKGAKMDEIVRKSTELGVFRIMPVLTRRTVPDPNEGSLKAKSGRWARIAEEAARQSQRASIPEVCSPTSLNVAADGLTAEGFDLILALYELEESLTLKQVMRSYVPEYSEKQSIETHASVLLRYARNDGSGTSTQPAGTGVQNIAVFVGPEGGFEKEEIDLLVSYGAKAVTIGETILRTETAGPAAIAMIMYELAL